jgi:hypothetical protein
MKRTTITKAEYDRLYIKCALCDNHPIKWESCGSDKNCYCALFRLQAEKDKVSYNIGNKKQIL